MISDVKENNERLFVINYYLSDDTIAVYELSCRNAGFKGGEFFGKSKIYFPNQDKYQSQRPIAYKSQDLYLGAVVNFRSFIFQIVSADIFALKFMEQHKDQVSWKLGPIKNLSVKFILLVPKKPSNPHYDQSPVEINSNLQRFHRYLHDES